MSRNEESAKSLRVWLKDQEDMQQKAVDQRDRLLRIRGASTSVGPWMDEAIEQAQSEIDHLSRSLDLTKRLIGLADTDQLHDPARG